MTRCPKSRESQATHKLRVYTRSASRNSRRNGRVRPQHKCGSTAGRSGARARMTGIPASLAAAAQLASSEAGTCNHARVAKAAKCLAVATKTSASACALGSGFSKANRIFTARSPTDTIKGTVRRSRQRASEFRCDCIGQQYLMLRNLNGNGQNSSFLQECAGRDKLTNHLERLRDD